MQCKNGSDVVVCLQLEEYVEMEVPIMPENPTGNNKQVWEYKMGEDREGNKKEPMKPIHCTYGPDKGITGVKGI